MKIQKLIGSVAAVVALTAAGVLYAVHPAKSSDHQDTYNLAKEIGHNASADLTDVYVFPSPTNSANVVLAMNVWPLIPTGLGSSKNFDPTLMWQFKISHGAPTSPEDQVIQFSASGTGTNQILTMYGPAAPAQVSTANTFVSPSAGSTTIGQVATLQNNTIKFYAGPSADPFTFDLFAFYTFLGDRNFATHTSQSDPGTLVPLGNGDGVPPTNTLAPSYDIPGNTPGPNPPTTPSFNGFAGGALSKPGGYACSTNQATNSLGAFNVLSFVVEIPKALLETNGASHNINVWATVSSSTVTN